MSYRISPAWWPIIVLSSPVLFPMLFVKNRRYKQGVEKSQKINKVRIDNARPLPMPELEHFELTVLLEQKSESGFLGAPGVSYFITTDLGSFHFDMGYGPENSALAHNVKKLGLTTSEIDALAISHLHPDHMGGFKAVRENQVTVPKEFGRHEGMTCFVPAEVNANGFSTEVVEGPRMLASGIASTGPLARSLFLMGWTEEQALVARLKHKGMVILTGCGHPTIETIVQMAKRLSDDPIYAIGGGLHFPITDSPLRKPGLKVQMIWGTGKPPWQRISKADLERTIENLNVIKPKHVFLSAHDTCDYAIDRFQKELKSETKVLKSGATYQL